MRLAWAFVRRDLLIAASYRANFAFALAGGVVTVTAFYFLAKLVGPAPVLRRYGADYFSFALLGLAIASCLRTLQATFAQRVREFQIDGSLEVLLAAPLSTFRIISYLAIYPVLAAMLKAGGLVVLGAMAFGAHLKINPLGFCATLVFALLPFAALGLLSAAVVLIFKRSDPVTYLLDTANYILCGVIYPVEVLPAPLQSLAKLLPATHALSALRAAGLSDATIPSLLPAWGILAAFAALLWPAAAVALAAARRHLERTGTLPHG